MTWGGGGSPNASHQLSIQFLLKLYTLCLLSPPAGQGMACFTAAVSSVSSGAQAEFMLWFLLSSLAFFFVTYVYFTTSFISSLLIDIVDSMLSFIFTSLLHIFTGLLYILTSCSISFSTFLSTRTSYALMQL